MRYVNLSGWVKPNVSRQKSCPLFLSRSLDRMRVRLASLPTLGLTLRSAESEKEGALTFVRQIAERL